MSAIVTELLSGIGAIWTWLVSTFVPATASDVTLIHFAMWSGTLLGIIGGLFRFVFRRR